MTGLEHHGIKGMRWGVRSSDSSSSKPPKPKKLSKAEVKAERADFYQAKATRMLETALKEPESLIALRTHNDRVIVTGQEFVNHMQRGGLMDITASDIYATRPGGKGPYVLNPNINIPFVRSDKKP